MKTIHGKVSMVVTGEGRCGADECFHFGRDRNEDPVCDPGGEPEWVRDAEAAKEGRWRGHWVRSADCIEAEKALREGER